MLIYSTVAVIFLILIVVLVRRGQLPDPDEALTDNNSTPNLGNGRWLDLSARIFDPSDARWLEEELAFPKLAKALVTARRNLAIRWLKGLRASFDEVVRVREEGRSESPDGNTPSGWQMLWLTYRFKFLIAYALFVVRLFGPYHRLIPSFSWVPLPQGDERSFRRPALADSRGSR